MSDRDNWFRNSEWNERIATDFSTKLRRARRKEQYIRIQASYLARTHPVAALALLEQYFALPDKFDLAIAHVTRAEALLSLGRVSEAVEAYEAALSREAEFPNRKTRTYLDLPYLIAVRNLSSHYDRALEVLDERKGELVFPVDHFMWHAARALILSESGNVAVAREAAFAALDAAAKDTSGFRFHPKIGLVSDKHAEALHRLRQFHDA